MTALTNQSDRFGGRAVLIGSGTDIDGDQALSFEQPNTFGDCMFESCRLSVSSLATMAANIHLLGPSMAIVHTAPVDTADVIGTALWVVVAGTLAAATAISATVEPYRPVLWRAGESLRLTFSEVDTNVAPTADLAVTVRVMRLRVS